MGDHVKNMHWNIFRNWVWYIETHVGVEPACVLFVDCKLVVRNFALFWKDSVSARGGEISVSIFFHQSY